MPDEHDAPDGPTVPDPAPAPPDNDASSPSAPVAPALTPERRRRLWFEVAVVLAIAWVLPVSSALMDYLGVGGEAAPEGSSGVQAVIYTAIMLQVCVPLLYLMSRSGEGFGAFGLRRVRPMQDLVFSLLFVVFTFAGVFVVTNALYIAASMLDAPAWILEGRIASDSDWTGARESGMPLIAWALFGVHLLANSVAEEFAMRAFLLQRLERLFASPTTAVVLSALVFASYHIYSGLYGISSAIVSGLLLGLLFVMTRRLSVCILGHTLWNLLVMLLDQVQV